MNRPYCRVFFLIMGLLLIGCGAEAVRRPAVLIDAEEYSRAGLQAYGDAEWRSAQHFFNKALLLYQGVDDQEGVLLSSINLAEVALAQHDDAAAKHYLTLADRIATDDFFQHYQPRISLLYGRLALQQKQWAEAAHRLREILPVFKGVRAVSVPDNTQIAAIASQVKLAFWRKQDELLWVQRYAHALKQTAHNNRDRQARLLRFQADLLLQQGAVADAESKLQQALLLYKQGLSRVGIAVTLLELAQYYQASQRWQDAQEYLTRSRAVYHLLGDDEKVKQMTDLLAPVKQ